MAETNEPAATSGEPALVALRVEIDHVVKRADDLAYQVDSDFAEHPGLRSAASAVAQAARQAEIISSRLGRFWNLHRLPVIFVAIALTVLTGWTYWQFFHVSKLSVALPDRDAVFLHKGIAQHGRVEFREVQSSGSRERTQLVTSGQVDLAFVQGGIPFPPNLAHLEIPGKERVLFFLHEDRALSEVRRVLTSIPDQGSHSVAIDFLKIWGLHEKVEYVHEWNSLLDDKDYRLSKNIDAVFVVKDPTDEKALQTVKRLHAEGFVLTAPILGVRQSRLTYLKPLELPVGHLSFDPPLPAEPLSTYAVSTFLVARDGLTPRQLAGATHLVDSTGDTMSEQGFELSVTEAGEMLSGIDAFLGILITIGVAFLALMGIDAIAYRKRFNELNSIISLISMYQSTSDVLGESPETVAHNVKYLSVCADLLGLIDVLTGYYTQENSSLLYNNLLTIIPERSNSLKLNIQLKILHANIVLPALETAPTAEAPPVEPSSEEPPQST
jgi:hypothetical protein